MPDVVMTCSRAGIATARAGSASSNTIRQQTIECMLAAAAALVLGYRWRQLGLG